MKIPRFILRELHSVSASILLLSASSGMAWQNMDVGATGASGSFTEAAGILTIRGAGAFTWADEKFHFVYLPLHGNGTGNGSITVKLTDQQNTNGNAQAGIVIRDNLTPNANTVALTRDPTGTLRFRYNQPAAPGHGWGYTTTVFGQGLPRWLKLERQGGAITGKHSTDGVNWTTIGSTTWPAMPLNTYMGMMVFSGVNGTLCESKFASVATTGTAPITGPWVGQDLGSPGIAGSGTQTIVPSNLFELKGSGTGFAGNSDSGFFVHQQVTGDIQIVARVSKQSGGDVTGPAALMIRETLNTASRNALISISGGNVVKFQAHANASDLTSSVSGPGGAEASFFSPYWLKLVRSGNVLSGYYSADGWNWVAAGSATVSLPASAYIGLAVSSKNNGQLKTAIFDRVSVEAAGGPPPSTFPVMTDITQGLTLVDEIDTATVAPSHLVPANSSEVRSILGKQARVLPTLDTQGNPHAQSGTAATMGYVIGANKGLVAGQAYILEVEYPDDTSRAMYITNRGCDHYRGLATGKAIGDARNQFVEPSAESLSFPHTGAWQKHRQFFYLLERFQNVQSVRDPEPGCRPRVPADGFHVAITRMKRGNDPRSEGAAVGKIRLYAVTNPAAIYAPINYPPPNLPQRSTFWREEMADQLLQTGTQTNQIVAISDPLTWHVQKMRAAKVLGINTYSKDLLEFGHNQGWLSDDTLYFAQNAQPPGQDVWNRMVPKAAEEGISLFPYYEYKGGIGTYGGLGNERRAQKLYHGKADHAVCGGNTAMYECISWTENNNADLTDPDTLVDAKRILDRTIGDLKHVAKFNGAWFRMRGCQLPMSFTVATLARFKAAYPGDAEVQTATQDTMIASYESTAKTLYNKYVNWWFERRKTFLIALRDHLRVQHGIQGAQILYSPWTSEAVPNLHHLEQYFSHIGIVTDEDPALFWNGYFNSIPVSHEKYLWQPTTYSYVNANGLYPYVLQAQRPLNHPHNASSEVFHSSPIADPERYQTVDGVTMSLPIGRMFTVENSTANQTMFNKFKSLSGLSVVRHYPLNEDDDDYDPSVSPTPFNGQLGYLSADCDRAGDHLMLMQARAVAFGDARYIGYLAGSSFNTGFPEVMRRFNQAFLAVPALPTTVVTGGGAPSNPAVVMRQVAVPNQGTFIYVANTSMSPVNSVTMTLPGSGNTVKDLVTNQVLPGASLNLSLKSGELRSYWVGQTSGNGTVVFNQDFSSSTTVGSYVNASNPGSNQFNDISAPATLSGWTINSGKLQLVHNGSGAAGITRHTDLPGSPSLISVDFDVTANGLDTWSPAMAITFGQMNATAPYGGVLAYGNCAASLTMHGYGTGSYRFRVNYNDYAAPVYSASQSVHVTWFINTSQQTRNYVGPDNQTYSLSDLKVDLWVNGVRVIQDKSPTQGFTSRALTDFYVTCQQNATYTLDNVVVRRLLP